jgi:hypothetical protein
LPIVRQFFRPPFLALCVVRLLGFITPPPTIGDEIARLAAQMQRRRCFKQSQSLQDRLADEAIRLRAHAAAQ